MTAINCNFNQMAIYNLYGPSDHAMLSDRRITNSHFISILVNLVLLTGIFIHKQKIKERQGKGVNTYQVRSGRTASNKQECWCNIGPNKITVLQRDCVSPSTSGQHFISFRSKFNSILSLYVTAVYIISLRLLYSSLNKHPFIFSMLYILQYIYN